LTEARPSLTFYLQVEAVMLGSAILVCLAGLMFNSDRFTGFLSNYYAKEYDGLVSEGLFNDRRTLPGLGLF
jgi:spore coat protein CotH